MTSFSKEELMTLAPDSSSLKSGLELAKQSKWQRFAANDEAVWGECQGSSAKPYKTCVDLRGEPAFKCSCPSRKFPCKHALALLFLRAQLEPQTQQSLFKQETPAWVQDWLAAKQERSEKPEAKTKSATDPAKKVKTQANRTAKVEAGITEFRLWLKDRIRQGLASLEKESYQFWDNAASRLTDAQAPGLARLLRQTASIPHSGEGWQERLLDRLAMMHMACDAFLRINELPQNMQADLRTVIGFTVSQEELLSQTPAIFDHWQIQAQIVESEDKLRVQRTWLRGKNTKRWALVLHFAHSMQVLDLSLVPGKSFEGELVFFPGSYPLRALVKSRVDTNYELKTFDVHNNLTDFYTDYSDAIAKNPFIELFPLALDEVEISYHPNHKKCLLLDQDRAILSLAADTELGLHMLALSGAHRISIFGEWNGSTIRPLSMLASGQFYSLEKRIKTDVA